MSSNGLFCLTSPNSKMAASNDIIIPILNYRWEYFSVWFTKHNKNNKGTRGSGLQEHNGWFPEVVSSCKYACQHTLRQFQSWSTSLLRLQVFSLFIFRIIISRKHVQIHESVSASALTVPPLPSAPMPCWKNHTDLHSSQRLEQSET